MLDAVAIAREHAEAVGRAVSTQTAEQLRQQTNAEEERTLNSTRAIQWLRAEVASIKASLGVREAVADIDTGLAATVSNASAPEAVSSELFYEQLEVRFRGSPSVIKERQVAYLEDILDGPSSDAPVVDLGSGRGEWLTILRDAGIRAYGVEMSERAVASARAVGLDVRFDDLVHHLASLDAGSVRAVTAFHVVEHLPFGRLLELLDECLRVLKPGGLVLVETPNGANVVVAASTFRLDPTHASPLHPLLLRLVFETRGFDPVEIRLLNPSDLALPIPTDNPSLARVTQTLNEYLFGPQDCAVLGRRPAPPLES
jgi:O-antigen chain-terminating methyltransferase